MNIINILTVGSNKTAVKKFIRHNDGQIELIDYDAGREYTRTSIEINSIVELYDLLKTLEDDQKSFIIRGEIRPEYATTTIVRRTNTTIPAVKQIGYFKDYDDGLNWVMLDFDKIDLPANISQQDSIEMLIARLPVEFHNASYCYQFSSSAGISGNGFVIRNELIKKQWNRKRYDLDFPGWRKVSAHIFFFLSKKVLNPDINTWAVNLNATKGHILDPASLRTVQPNYTARPVFRNMLDPLASTRSGLVRKACDTVDLVPIATPDKFVDVDGQKRKVGDVIKKDGKIITIQEYFSDKLNRITGETGSRDLLAEAIKYYWRRNGTYGNAEKLTDVINQHWAAHGLPERYLGSKLDSMVSWYETIHGQHTPRHDPDEEQKLRDRLTFFKNKAASQTIEEGQCADTFQDEPGWNDDFSDDIEDDYSFEKTETNLTYYFNPDPCGAGKTESLIDKVANSPNKYICCFPKISLLNEVMHDRLEKRHGDLPHTINYHYKVIYSMRTGDFRDDADDDPDDTKAYVSVTEQLEDFRWEIDHHQYKNVVLFITHAALLQTDWREWKDFTNITDEIFECFISRTYDATENPNIVKKFITTTSEESNYYYLGLTPEGEHKLSQDGHFDLHDAALQGILEAIKNPNMIVAAAKKSWDNMHAQKIRFMRLVNPAFMAHFKQVTIMGDDFESSLLAKAWVRKFGVNWQQDPEWQTRYQRAIPLSQRARIHYFVDSKQERASAGLFSNGKIIRQIQKFLTAETEGQVLITTNLTSKKLFEKPVEYEQLDDVGEIERVSKKIKLLWESPKMHGSNLFRHLRHVAWFCALRSGDDENEFIHKSLDITENEIIEWREYNAMYQFVMRSNLRVYESKTKVDVYVYDVFQANYLVKRFGPDTEVIFHKDVLKGTQHEKPGRKRKENPKTTKERSARQTAKKKAERHEAATKTAKIKEFMDKLNAER